MGRFQGGERRGCSTLEGRAAAERRLCFCFDAEVREAGFRGPEVRDAARTRRAWSSARSSSLNRCFQPRDLSSEITNTRAHTCNTHIEQAHLCTLTEAHLCAHTHRHTCAHAHTHIDTCTPVCTMTQAHLCMLTHVHTPTDTCTPLCMTGTPVHTHTRAHTHMRTQPGRPAQGPSVLVGEAAPPPCLHPRRPICPVFSEPRRVPGAGGREGVLSRPEQ